MLPAVALLWKGLWLWHGAFPFNADEAVVALMARHILQGEHPVFFYGQAYMGSLDAFLVAAAFSLIGQKVAAIRVVQALLYAATVDLSALFALRLTRKPTAAWVTGLLLAMPTVNMTLYTTVSLGGYGEALLIGTALLLLAISRWVKKTAGAFVFGFLAGLGLWAFGLVLVYAVPAAAFVWLKRWEGGFKRKAALTLSAALGAAAGASPWWWYGVTRGWAPLFHELLGSAVAVEHTSWLLRAVHHFLNLVLLGIPVTLGLRPPWSVEVLAPPLAVLALSVYVFWAWQALRNRKKRRGEGWALGWGVAAVLLTGFIFTSFGVDPSGRYFLPLTQMLFVGLGAFVAEMASHKRWMGWLALGAVLLFHIAGTVQAANNPYRLTTQFAPDARVRPGYKDQLIAFLNSHNLRYGYTNYWVAYPLAFLSHERMIFVPRLPYHEDMRYTPRDDRYPPYDRAVITARRIAYITTGQRLLEARLRAGFRSHGVSWREAVIGDYRIFYDLTTPIPPWELGISPPPNIP